jgi:hypothetical protein
MPVEENECGYRLRISKRIFLGSVKEAEAVLRATNWESWEI